MAWPSSWRIPLTRRTAKKYERCWTGTLTPGIYKNRNATIYFEALKFACYCNTSQITLVDFCHTVTTTYIKKIEILCQGWSTLEKGYGFTGGLAMGANVAQIKGHIFAKKNIQRAPMEQFPVCLLHSNEHEEWHRFFGPEFKIESIVFMCFHSK